MVNCPNCHFGLKKRKKFGFLIFGGSKMAQNLSLPGPREWLFFLGVALELSWGLVVTIQSAALS